MDALSAAAMTELEQEEAEMREAAKVVGAYYRGLQVAGLSEQQAWALVRDWHSHRFCGDEMCDEFDEADTDDEEAGV